MIIINLIKSDYYQESIQNQINLNDNQFYEFIIIIAWNLLKCLSFCLDNCTNELKNNLCGINSFLGYTFYYPTIFLGPFMIFERYGKFLEDDLKNQKSFLLRFGIYLKDVMTCGFWMMVIEFSLHFIYINCLQYNPEVR